MRTCSVTRGIKIIRGSADDYRRLVHYHYRDGGLGPYAGIFAITRTRVTTGAGRPTKRSGNGTGTPASAGVNLSPRKRGKTIGVIVYTMPAAGLELRNIATANAFSGFDRVTGMALVNKNIRCISRVIIEPRFRGLGLASRLVRETMPRMGVPIVESMAVMGLVNPFFEKAGMTAYRGKIPARCVQLVEALSVVGIKKELLIDPQKVQSVFGGLKGAEAEFAEYQIKKFLQSYGKRRNMRPGLERTRYILSKLTDRPVYYIWFNPEMKLLTS